MKNPTRFQTFALRIIASILLVLAFPAHGQIANDADTLLLLRFDGNANGVLGETPSSQASLSYVPGVSGQGASFAAASRLAFASSQNINALEGTLDLWIKPNWTGSQSTSPFFLEWGGSGGMLFFKNNAFLRSLFNRFSAGGNPEAGASFGQTADLRAGEWIHLAFTWSNTSKQTAVYLNGIRFAESTFAFDLPAIGAATFNLGGQDANSADGVVDELRISSRVRTDAEILATYRAGQTALGRGAPPAVDALTEGNASAWSALTTDGTNTVSNDSGVKHNGASSIRMTTTGGLDAWVVYPGSANAFWDFPRAGSGGLAFWAFAQNTNSPQFQNDSPWIRLYSAAGNYFELHPTSDVLNSAIGTWREFTVPFAGDATWVRTVVGRPSLHQINRIEFHADTWGAGFQFWIDNLRFDLPPTPPSNVRAYAGAGRVDLSWSGVDASSGLYTGYKIYRDTVPFTTAGLRTPIATINNLAATTYADLTATNGVHWHYAVVGQLSGGSITEPFTSIGPRTPRAESDLQISAIARTPRFPRYAPSYTSYSQSEPGGFGPYNFSAATGLGNGQTASTQRFPNVGDAVTYTATIRNRGTLDWSGKCAFTWTVDGVVAATGLLPLNLVPGAVATTPFARTWDNADHEIRCTISPTNDARPANNTTSVWTKSAAFLSYLDRTYAETFRETSASAANAVTDDIIDWLQRHMVRFNELLSNAGTRQRVHYDILEVLDDAAPDPSVSQQPFAIFPFRFRAGEGSLRTGSGYYSASDDLDYGLLHEEGHQLGLIDLYRLDVSPSANLVSGLPYNGPACLMNGVSHFLSPNSAGAMELWADKAHGYFGQYLYRMADTVRVRFLRADGAPLVGATVKMYQKIDRAGVGEIIPNEIKASGVTDASGVWTLPNVPINPALVPTTFAGDMLKPNPFGYLAVIGTNGVLHFRVDFDGATDWAWLDVTEVNVAWDQGQRTSATFTRNTTLGGLRQTTPPVDMAEFNADVWSTYAQDGTFTAAVDTSRVHNGGSSIRFTATGGFLNVARYPGARNSHWNLTGAQNIRFWAFATNTNSPQFQNTSPIVRLYSGTDYYEYTPPSDLLNNAIGHWVEFVIPIAGNGTWRRTTTGTPNLADAGALAIHSDTWGSGYVLWLDGVRFDPQPAGALDFLTWSESQPIVPGARGPLLDPDGDGLVNFLEFALGGSNGQSDAALQPTGARDATGYSFTWKQRKGASGLGYTAQRSVDLASWGSATGLPQMIGQDALSETWRVIEPAPLPERLHLRLRVMEAP